MAYLTIQDLHRGIHREVLSVISRSEDNALHAIAEAQAEVESYLTARYDIRSEWNRSGDDRCTMVVKLVRDIAIYNCYNISNPVNMPESRRDAYKDAISFLKEVQAERSSIDGLTRKTGTTGTSSYVSFGGNIKRKNQF